MFKSLKIILLILSLSSFLEASLEVKEKRSDSADYRKAIQAKTAKNYKSAIKLFIKLSQKNYGRAKYNLGIMYLLGLGVKKDEEVATILFKQAVDLGNLEATTLMGEKYYSGIGVEQNKTKAKELLLRAKNAGDPKAKFLWKKYKFDTGTK